MKKSLLLLLTLIAFTLFAQDIKKLDSEYGFRGNSFGKLITEFKDMVFVTGTGEVKIFQGRNEDLGIGDGTAKKITYEFYKNKFYKVNIEAKGQDNSSGILHWLQSRYGLGTKSGAKGEKCTWLGTRVMISYRETTLTHDATIEIFSKEIADRVDKDKDRLGE